MAAVTSRAPRVFAKHTSMSAAALRYTTPDHSFSAAWFAIWTACGGAVIEDKGHYSAVHPVVDELTARSMPAIGFHLDSAEEQRGALKALASLAFLAGPGAIGSAASSEVEG